MSTSGISLEYSDANVSFEIELKRKFRSFLYGVILWDLTKFVIKAEYHLSRENTDHVRETKLLKSGGNNAML